MYDEKFSTRLKHAWNAFREKPDFLNSKNEGSGSYVKPDRPRLTRGNERSIVTSVYNRIAMDVASITINHVKLDKNNRMIEVIDSGLNNCLNLEANIDQTGRELIQDIVLSVLDEGCVAVVPVDTSINPSISGSYNIETLRVGKITQWYPTKVSILLYNDRKGKKETVTLPKKNVAIIQNPLYAVMNEPNSTINRLNRKLALLDIIDDQNGSGKLNLIVQLPYVIKSPARKKQAEERTQQVEDQLSKSKYGVAYIDGTEHITQLNRSLENNLLSQIEYLTSMLYSQLGISESVMNGNADERAMLNYRNRTIEPLISAIVDEFKRKFLTKTARTQRQSISFYSDPFKLVPVNEIASIADTFTRNEICSSNEIRQILGMPPSDDPKADELRNKNLSVSSKELENESENKNLFESLPDELKSLYKQ